MKIGIMGTGMFGFAISRYLGKKYLSEETVSIVAYDINKELIEHLKKTREHLYHFKGKKSPKNVLFTNNKKEVARDADIIIMAVVSQAIREVIKGIKNYLKNDVIIVNTAKALEIGTGKTFSEVVTEELENQDLNFVVAKLSGGMFAEDLVNDVPLGADIACEDKDILRKLQKIFHSSTLRVYANTDLIGVEYAGAFKNVIAILAGIINGLGLPYGSETHMISRAAKEAKDIAVALGAKSHTFSMESQCWGNDLWMSCTGKSRNREFGKLIGSGFSPKEALNEMKKKRKLVEGYYTARVIPMLCEKTRVRAPILSETYKIVYEEKDPMTSIKDIMDREAENIGSI